MRTVCTSGTRGRSGCREGTLFSVSGTQLKAVCMFSSGFQSYMVRESEVTQLFKMVETFYFKPLYFPFLGVSLIFVLT